MNWPAVKLGVICRLNYGKSLQGYLAEQVDGFSVQVFGTNGPIGWTRSALAHGPAIIIGRKGAYRGVHLAHGPSWTIDTAYYMEIDDTKIDLSWFYYRLLLVDINGMNSGGAIPSTRREDFYSLTINMPEKAIQSRVATILSAYDNLIENNRRRIALLEEAARKLYREWFVHFRFPGHEHTEMVDGLPQGWKLRNMDRCASFQSGGTPSKAKAQLWTGDIPWTSSGELKSMRVSTLILIESFQNMRSLTGVSNRFCKHVKLIRRSFAIEIFGIGAIVRADSA